MLNEPSNNISQYIESIDKMLVKYHSRISANASHGFTVDAIKNAWFGELQHELLKLQAAHPQDSERIILVLREMYRIVIEKVR